jgi:hypothetical protein
MTSFSPLQAIPPTNPNQNRRLLTSDALTLSIRCLRISRRELDTLIMAVVLPVFLMLMFVDFFGNAIHAGTEHYVTHVVPVFCSCAPLRLRDDCGGGLPRHERRGDRPLPLDGRPRIVTARRPPTLTSGTGSSQEGSVWRSSLRSRGSLPRLACSWTAPMRHRA